MTDREKIDYDALEARLTDPAVPLEAPLEVRTGAAAAQFGRDFMLREYGSEEALASAMRRPGRPRVGAEQNGASPVVRGAIPAADYEALDAFVKRSGKKQSAIVREAVHEYLVGRKLVS
ncbi:ribbon-helix-helix protein, CopG family [Plantibacter sp. RU18]|uniref:ribbon-helix-helix protein, CopG family n=1 Tax=Plantibacter sp. RU18 TaxID=3158143 RepID=UPI003D36F2B4